MKVEILTLEKKIMSMDAKSVIVPGRNGKFESKDTVSTNAGDANRRGAKTKRREIGEKEKEEGGRRQEKSTGRGR